MALIQQMSEALRLEYQLNSKNLGILYGISAGPGDPELITVKGLRILQASPVVAFPAGRGDRSGIAQTIIQPWLQPHQQQLPLYFSFAHDRATLTAAWVEAAQQTLIYLRQGQDVAFVSEGDVNFYSTFSYLAQEVTKLESEVQFRAIPGVCSPLAAAAAQGQPLTLWEQRLTVLPTVHRLDQLAETLDRSEVVVLMKVSSVYRSVWALLKQRELLDRSYIIERCSSENEKIYTQLKQFPDLVLSYFSIWIIQVK
ncbi:MAG: precorrin-2 C(20)-methyltransferase [Prochlorothrix sp.]